MNNSLAHGCEVQKNKKTLVFIKSSYTGNKVPCSQSKPASYSLQTE
jgi:hypothetical protein